MTKKIAIIGGGWYGSHIGVELGKKGYDVTLFEKNPRLFSEISGKFGIRLHIGPHYPRSPQTRRSCLYGFHEFSTKYPELIVPHEYSIYAVGNKDANGESSKVTVEDFVNVCQENSKCHVIYDPDSRGYKNLLVAIELAEPSIYLGRGLHKCFEKRLKDAGVKLKFNYDITSLRRDGAGKIQVENNKQEKTQFDYVVNATSFQSLLPTRQLKLPFNVVYQPCLALRYRDKAPTSDKPFSMIVMDGWFPCLMPSVNYDDRDRKQPSHRYILTHGKWTIMGSYATAEGANARLKSTNDDFINKNVRPNCEQEMCRFWPVFKERFEYLGWVGAVLAKIKNNREHRSSVVLQELSSGVIHVHPGKVSNIFDAADEVTAFIENQYVLRNEKAGYAYIKGGTLESAMPEFKEPITQRNTCDLQTFNKESSRVNVRQSYAMFDMRKAIMLSALALAASFFVYKFSRFSGVGSLISLMVGALASISVICGVAVRASKTHGIFCKNNSSRTRALSHHGISQNTKVKLS